MLRLVAVKETQDVASLRVGKTIHFPVFGVSGKTLCLYTMNGENKGMGRKILRLYI